jgi:two-component system, OmpR family, sensor histidine kinase KdpD
LVEIETGGLHVFTSAAISHRTSRPAALGRAAKASQWVRRVGANEYVSSVGIIAITTAIGLVLRSRLQITDVAMLFLLAVVVVAYRHHRGPALLACVLSIVAFDFGFVPPYYTLDVHDAAYFLTFGVMLVVALVMTQLTTHIRGQAEDAREREQRTSALFALSREFATVENLAGQMAIAERHIGQAVRGEASAVLQQNRGESSAQGWPDDGVFDSVAVRVAASWAYEYGESAGWGTAQCAEAEALVIPLKSSSRTMGVVTIRPASPERILSAAERRTMEALAGQAATALERTLLAQGHEQARIEVESERLRTALLSSLSHDLRTPLGSIEGAASSLLQESGVMSQEVQREMAETILEESRRMTRLVTNLLDMVRVETGDLAVHKEWQPLEEALGVTLLRLEERLAKHTVETRLPQDLPLVPIDELLIEQVFINLLENAAKYTGAGTTISVSAWQERDAVVVEVADTGGGIPQGDEEAVFRKFHRVSGADQAGPAGGSGLGLTICRGIVAAHGGRIWLERGAGVGAAFRFTLPLGGQPPELPPTEGAA